MTTEPFRWSLSWRADPAAAALADRHYSRRRSSIGSTLFSPPGRVLVLTHPGAYWVTSWPYYARHAYPDAWTCSAFRREAGDVLASEMIRAAVAHTRWRWPHPPDTGMITFVDPAKVHRKRDPGRCFLRAGFRRVAATPSGLLILQMSPADMPAPLAPLRSQEAFAL